MEARIAAFAADNIGAVRTVITVCTEFIVAFRAVVMASGACRCAVTFTAPVAALAEFRFVSAIKTGVAAIIADDLGAVCTSAARIAYCSGAFGTAFANRAGIIICTVDAQSAIIAHDPIVITVCAAYGALHAVLVISRNKQSECYDSNQRK